MIDDFCTIRVEKSCLICGTIFIDHSSCQCRLTCSSECREKLYRLHHPDKDYGSDFSSGFSFDAKISKRLDSLKKKSVPISNQVILDIRHKLILGVCEICGRQMPLNRLDIDHDHKTSRYRGILCDRCNQILGRVHDDVKILQSAINYLNKFNS